MKLLKTYKGYTVLELLVVIAMFLIILGIGMPVFGKVSERYALIAYSRELVGDIRYVRQTNINGNLLLRIQISNDKYIIREGLKIIEIKETPKGVRFMSDLSFFIHFNSLGVPLGIGATTINLINSYGHIYQVIITVNTGRVRYQPHPDSW